MTVAIWQILQQKFLIFSSIFSHETARNSRKVGSYTDSWPQLACSARLCHYRRRPLRRPHLVDIQPQIVKIEKTLLLKTKKDTEKKESYHRDVFLLQWGYRVFANFHSAPAPPKSIKIPRNSKDSNQVEWEPCHLPSLLLEDLSSNSVFFVTMVLRTDTSSRHSYSSAFFISLFPYNSLLFFDASSLKRRTNESPPFGCFCSRSTCVLMTLLVGCI